MFAIRYYGMLVRKDGLMTDNNASALLFDTVAAAEAYVKQWKITSQVQQTGVPAEIVEVEVKIVLKK